MTESVAKAGPFTAIVLAGQRAEGDPLAQSRGMAWKALVPVAGRPMVEHVLLALLSSSSIGRIAVSAPTPDLLAGIASLQDALARGRILVLPTEAGPAASTAAAWKRLGRPCPTLVTTADHALLTPELVDRFCREAAAGDADVHGAVVSASSIRAAFPTARRTYLRFTEEAYSGANLFLLASPQAERAIAFWERVEQDRKRPWRIARQVGLGTLLLFLLRRLSLQAALARLSRAAGARCAAITLPEAWASVDVDKPEDLHLAEQILAERGKSTR